MFRRRRGRRKTEMAHDAAEASHRRLAELSVHDGRSFRLRPDRRRGNRGRHDLLAQPAPAPTLAARPQRRLLARTRDAGLRRRRRTARRCARQIAEHVLAVRQQHRRHALAAEPSPPHAEQRVMVPDRRRVWEKRQLVRLRLGRVAVPRELASTRRVSRAADKLSLRVSAQPRDRLRTSSGVGQSYELALSAGDDASARDTSSDVCTSGAHFHDASDPLTCPSLASASAE